MKKTTTNYLLWMCLLLSALTQKSLAQSTAIIGAGSASGTSANGAGTDPGPAYRSSGTSTFIYARHHYLYTQAELATAGITPGATITMLSWNKDNAHAFTGPAVWEIWMKNSSLTIVPTPPQAWSTLTTGSTQVYNVPTTLPATIGYIDFPFTTPFTYTGGALEISVNYDHSAIASPWSTTVGLSWKRDPITNVTISYVGATPNTTLSNLRTVRPQLKITFTTTNGYNNAGVTAITSPSKFCTLSQDIKTQIRNKGKNKINNVVVNWEVDAVAQSPITINSVLDTVGGVGASDTILNLGNLVFTPGVSKSIRIWTSLPNGVADTVTNDDTLYAVLKSGLNGTYNIGPFSSDYTTISAAVNDLNKYGICGPVTFNVDANSTYTENPIILTQSGSAANPITFQKSGAGSNPVVYGKNGTGTLDAVIALSGVNYVTFDGIDVMDSISNTTAISQMEYGFGIVNSSGTTGSNNNKIQNCKVTLNRTNVATIGIAQSTLTTATSFSGANHNNRYENIRVENSYGGILLLGTAAFPDSNNVITSSGTDTTVIGGLTAGDIGAGTAVVTGINVSEQRNIEVSKCVVRNVSTASTGYSHGIWLNNTAAASNYGTAKIFNNQVLNLVRTTAASAAASALIGIRIDVAVLGSARVYNNVIHSISATNTTFTAGSVTVRGMAHGISVLTGNAEFYHNSVNLNNTNTMSGAAAFTKAATGQTILRNNILSVHSVAQTGNPKHFAAHINVANPNIISTNNVLWSTPTTNGFAGYGGATLADRITFQAYAASISTAAPTNGNETGSAFANPNFVSNSDLTFSTATPAALSGMSIPAFAITTDIAGNTRSATEPTIGAYETVQSLLDSSAPVISNIVINNSTSPSVYATIKDNNSFASFAGNVTLWYRLGTTGVFTGVAPDSIPAGSLNGTYKWSASLSAIPSGPYQFYIAARDMVGPGSNIAVNPIQNVSFTSFASIDPANFGAANPDVAANTRLFVKVALLPAGTYSVGPTGTYLKLTDVVNALNSSELLGDVVFEFQNTYNGTTGEIFPLTINPLTVTSPNLTATIRPQAGATALVTSGDPGSALPLITLNGADRVIFDGRPGGIGSAREWTIRNTRTAATLSPTFQFINDAQKDTLEYLNIESGNTTAAGGTIVISTTTETVGNDAIVIRNNKIRDRSDVAGVHANAIYAAGTATAVNDDVVITGNELLNFSGIGIAVTATGNGQNWRINNNHLYSNIATAPTTAQTGISFLAASNNNQINNNYIGGSNVNAGGTPWTNSGANAFVGITASFDSVILSTVSGNVVGNIVKSATGAASFNGIAVTRGASNITSNVIGDTVNANSIVNAGTGVTIGINLTNTLPNTTTTVDNNRIANITATNAGTGAIFRGVSYTAGSGNPVCHTRFNKIFNIINAAATTGYAAGSIASQGIYYFPTGYTFNCEIKNNTIYNIADTNSVATAPTNVSAITLTNTHGTIANNIIYDIFNSSKVGSPVPSTANGLYFRFLETGTFIVNNMVSLNGNPASDSVQMNGVMITGANGGAQGYLYNTIRIGNATGSPVKSFAFHRGENSTTTQSYQPVGMKNNLFINTVNSPGLHFAIGSEGNRPDSSWLIGENDYNDMYSVNAGNTTLWGTVIGDLASWKSLSGGDVHSVYSPVVFVNPTAGDLHLTGASIGNFTLAGVPYPGFTTDIDGQTRSTIFPYMGADENLGTPLMPVDLVAFTAQKINDDVMLNWTTASENNASHFEIERSADGKMFDYVSRVKAAGNSTIKNNYRFNDEDALTKHAVLYYRLKMIDIDGKFEYSQTRVVRNDDTRIKDLTVYPNPSGGDVSLSLESTQDRQAQVKIMTITGKHVLTTPITIQKGQNIVPVMLSELDPGMYILMVEADGENQQVKLLKH